MTTFSFVNSHRYSRNDVLALLGMNPVPKWGPYVNGYFEYQGAYFIFCNVGVAGRTGHDYANRFEGDDLFWTGKTGAKATHESIRRMVTAGAEVHVFFRENNSEPFTYIGLAHAVSVDDAVPVGVWWSFSVQNSAGDPYVRAISTHKEGASVEAIAKHYERSPAARAQCIKHYGATCQVCDMDFAKKYGTWGEGFIHVHHHKPISSASGPYLVDPIKDLIPVCPNCHAMLHRKKDVITVQELRDWLHDASLAHPKKNSFNQ